MKGGPSEFRFKQFVVRNEVSAMKVNTDGVILGASLTLARHCTSAIDIGTGTGTIALMAAQRLGQAAEKHGDKYVQASVTGIDIDAASAAEAGENFRNSRWSSSLQAVHASLREFSALMPPERKFGNIFSNPPYYTGALKAPDERRNTARHSEALSWAEIVDFASCHLEDSGILSLILPAEQRTELSRYAAANGLYLFRALSIRTVPGKTPRRAVTEFSPVKPAHVMEETLTIQEGGAYTPEYRSLLSEFLINF